MRLAEVFGPPEEWPPSDLVALSDDFDADLVLAAYASGVFPMPLQASRFDARMGWWSPLERAYLPLEDLRVTRSLRKSSKQYVVTVDTDFAGVLDGCGDPRRPHGWIDGDIRRIYTQLFQQGFVHSVETWGPDGELAGGLYGVSLGGLFAGESMFHRARDASKVALVALVEILRAQPQPRLLDVQWLTPHLESLGATSIDRAGYLDLLDIALDQPSTRWPPAQRKERHA